MHYLEDYIGAVEKIHKEQAKEYERVLKVRGIIATSHCDCANPAVQTISKPLREGNHFDQSLGGVAGFYENLRSNTQALINTNAETEKSIRGSVLPVLARLHKEIKNKASELAHGAEKGAKEVDKARNTTQKHIELLGQQSCAISFKTVGSITRVEHPNMLIHVVLPNRCKVLCTNIPSTARDEAQNRAVCARCAFRRHPAGLVLKYMCVLAV